MASNTIDFVLEGLESTLSMAVSGQLADETIPGITSDAVAEITVSAATMKTVFQFQTDSLDVDNVDSTDILYYVNKANWPTTLNPADATVVTTPILAGASNNAVKHDFVRHLAVKLFNTHHGVDLFSNEAALVSDLTTKGADVNTNIIDVVLNEVDINNSATGNGTAGDYHLTNKTAEDLNKNFSRRLLQQLAKSEAGRARLNTSATGGIAGQSTKQGIPFVAGDSISFKLTIQPAANQGALTGVADPTNRVYQIKLLMGA